MSAFETHWLFRCEVGHTKAMPAPAGLEPPPEAGPCPICDQTARRAEKKHLAPKPRHVFRFVSERRVKSTKIGLGPGILNA